jgi:hypothetical protein
LIKKTEFLNNLGIPSEEWAKIIYIIELFNVSPKGIKVEDKKDG